MRFPGKEPFESFAISFIYPVLLWLTRVLQGLRGPGQGAGPGPSNHIPYPVYEGRHLRVHIGGLGVTAPESGEGDKAVGPVPAHQGPPRVSLGVEGNQGQRSISGPLSPKELL